MPNLALSPKFWTSLGVETSAAAGALGMMKQRCSLLHSTASFILQQRGSRPVGVGCHTGAAFEQQSSQVGEPRGQFLELAPRSVFLDNPSKKPQILDDLLDCS